MHLLSLQRSGRFDQLRQRLFADQPPEGTGGFTTRDLIELGREVGLTDTGFVSGVQEGRYERWVLQRESLFQSEDPQGTPAAWLNGSPIDSRLLFDTLEFKSALQR